MTNLTLDVAALDQLPEVESVELGYGHGGGGCFLITCVITCGFTVDTGDDW